MFIKIFRFFKRTHHGHIDKARDTSRREKRFALNSIDGNRTTKTFKANRISLMKMAQTTRTFPTQAEALQFIVQRQKNEGNLYAGEILYLFCFQSQPDGRRRYQVADIDVFIHEYYQLPRHQRHTYEIIIDKKPSKLYFDLEFDISANPNLDGPQLTMNFVQFVLSFMRRRSDELNYSFEDVLILDSTSSTKFSRHLIFQMTDPFLDNLAVGRFVNLILEDIHGCLINHQCSAMSNYPSIPNQSSQLFYTDSIIFAKNLLDSLESYRNRFDQCFCRDEDSQLRYRDLWQFIVQKRNGHTSTWFCDTGVYTKNRAFRLYRSSKFNRTECFVVASENQWKPSIERDSRRSADQIERETFLASLVYFNGTIRRFIHVDEEIMNTRSNQRLQSTQSTSKISYMNEDLQAIALNYPELYEFMSNVARDGSPEDFDYRVSRLYRGKEVQNDFRWEISFMYYGKYKYCENIRRHHRHNNIYFVVDMRKGTYRQKCHDSDCKSFQGIERPLPSHVTPWLTILNEEWDATSTQTDRPMQQTL